MKVLLDLSPLKSGGGVQIALNFLDAIRDDAMGLEWFLLLPELGPLSETTESNVIARAPSNPLARAYFEYRVLPKLLRTHAIDLIFTHFGPGLPHSPDVKSVVGVAYPIVCYPDSPFWGHLSASQRLRQIAINKARLARLRLADHVVVETAVMRERIAGNAGIALERMSIVAPYPSAYVQPQPQRPRNRDRPYTFLFLSGLGAHKNLWRLPQIARAMRNLNRSRYRFALSVSERDWAARGLATDADFLANRQHFAFLDAVPPQEINRAYAQADALVSLSDLESFSNNYMEAWKARIPLLVSDRDFAHHICRKSALYVEPHEPVAVATAMAGLMDDVARGKRLVSAGDELLAALPTQTEKLSMYVDLLRRVANR